MQRLIGLKVVGIYGYSSDKRIKSVKPCYILFSDKKTIMVLEEQDFYTYHDCSSSARNITITQDQKLWNTIFNNKTDIGVYLKSNIDL